MRLNVTPGGQVPDTDEGWVNRGLRSLQQRTQELAADAGELTGAVIRRGLMVIRDFGGLVIRALPYRPFDKDNTEFDQYRWGVLPDDPLYNRPDGQRQMAFLAYRDDKTLGLAIAELRANDGQYGQAVLIFDKTGAIIVSEDGNSGRGLARPHIPWSTPQPTNTAQWLTHSPPAGDTSWTSIARVEVDPDNACMWWNVRSLIDAGVTAQYRWCWQLDGSVEAPVLLKADGTTAIHTNTWPAGSTPAYNFGFWRETNVPFPTGVVPQRRTTLDLQVRMTAGADGTHVAKASVLALGGDQS